MTWRFHVERIRYLTVLGDRGRPEPGMSSQAAEAMAVLGWERTRARRDMPFFVSSDGLSQHQRPIAIVRIEEALRRS